MVMNANELANWIEKGAPYREYETAKQTAIVLRQQQVEIEALKKNLDVALMIVNEPAKTLTDEEIIEIGNAVTNLIDSNEGWIEFARAILKKASEK